ncbi:MAG: orotate phosphoribosyltransferase [Erysipelothrix sp.]|nr:orotate phosphoribosyltransferase [Erysipelothrix sp.]
MLNTAESIALDLLKCSAVSLSPNNYYTWVSGIKSPIYCDNRITISYPEVREKITHAFVDLIQKEFPDVDAIVGTATAGIPQAAWVSDRLKLPMAYVRTKKKEHGKGQQIEGRLEKNARVIVIEDLVSSGKSSIEVCHILKEEGYEVLALCSIFTYELTRAKQSMAKNQIKHLSLSNYSSLLKVAKSESYISDEELKELQKWNLSL